MLVVLSITITLDFNKYKKGIFDVAVNNEQVIRECLKIINESLNLNLDCEGINYCKSKREKRLISTESNFKENNIYTGDILEFV